MSMRTLLIWIIIAGLLGGAVLAVRTHKTRVIEQHTPTTTTLGIDLAAVVSVTRVVGPEREVLERDPAVIDRWVIRCGGDDPSYAWEADPVKARSGLRALATARVVRNEPEQAPEEQSRQNAGHVVVRTRDGTETRIDFGGASAGGQTPVRVVTRGPDGVATGRWGGRIEKSVADAFMSGSLRGWRRAELFDMAASSVRGVSLESGPYATTLTRTSSGWMVEAPVTVHAEPETVEGMVKSLLSSQAAAFVDEPIGDDASGMSRPLAVITLRTQDEPVTLRIGTRADVEGDLVYARIERGDGSTLIKIETKSLGKLTAVPDAYVGKTPSAHGSTEVRGVRVVGKDDSVKLDAVRSPGGWQINASAADSMNRDATDRLLRLLMGQPASGVRILDTPQELSEFAWVELVGRDSAVLDRFGVALDGSDGGMRVLFVRDLGQGQRVVWAQRGDDAMATGAWLTAVASRRVGNN